MKTNGTAESLVCPICGESVVRKSYQQIFCSVRCRVASFRQQGACNAGPLPLYPNGAKIIALRANPIGKTLSDQGCVTGQKHEGRSAFWRTIVEAELFSGRHWRSVTSPDGVQVQVTRLRPATIQRRHP
jgi:hypothetical protein